MKLAMLYQQCLDDYEAGRDTFTLRGANAYRWAQFTTEAVTVPGRPWGYRCPPRDCTDADFEASYVTVPVSRLQWLELISQDGRSEGLVPVPNDTPLRCPWGFGLWNPATGRWAASNWDSSD